MQPEYDEQNEITTIGNTDWRNTHIPFGIKAKDRLQHIYVIGKTGVGKSTLLENMAIADIEHGHGLAVVDPHGDSAESLLDHITQSRIDDVIYFNPGDTDYPIGFNPLYNVAAGKRHVISSILISTFKKIWSETWGPRLEYILRLCILTLLESGKEVTLLDVQPLLVNNPFRKEVLRNITNTQILSFWHDEYDKYPPPLRSEAISPILNKIGIFSANPILRNIVGQQKSGFDLQEILQHKKILICNLSKGILGEDVSALLGSMLVSAIHFTALQRAELPLDQRHPFYLYIDEMHSFISLSFADILSEARKYGLSLFLTHQYLDQLQEAVRTSIFGNIGTIISFRVGAEDAEYLAKEFYPIFSQSDFINLPPYAMYIKLMIDGLTSKAFSAQSLPITNPLKTYKHMIMRQSREAFACKKKIVEQQLIQKQRGISNQDSQASLFSN